MKGFGGSNFLAGLDGVGLVFGFNFFIEIRYKTRIEMYHGSDVIHLSAKDFVCDDDSVRIKNRDLLGSFGILKVYAPWCGACRAVSETYSFLGRNLREHGLNVCVLNGDDSDNNEVIRGLNVSFFPSFYMIRADGLLDNISDTDRSIEGLLQTICKKTREYAKDDMSKSKCCRKAGGRIIC